MSAPFSCISVAIVWRNRWQEPVLPSLRRLDALLDREAQMIAAERLALGREEHGHVVRLDGKLRTALPDVLLQPCYGPLADGHIAVLLALALADQDQPRSSERS